MKPKFVESTESKVPPAEKIFYIVGSRKLQNELISYYMAREAGVRCLVSENICQLPFLPESSSDHYATLVFWDCLGKDPEEVLIELDSWGEEALSRVYLVLFNIARGLGFEEKLVWEGVRGFFYEHDSLDRLLKGIHTVLKGELWLSREIVSKCILENKGRDFAIKQRNSILTPREVEILVLVASWATNDEIGEKLNISTHTVKTHLYNIFKKIDVPNRLQAAFWATKNLERFFLK